MLATLTFWLVWVYVAFQPELTCWLPGNANASVQPLIGAPLLVMPTATVAPLPQSFWTVYRTTQAGVAAPAGAATVRPPSSTAAAASPASRDVLDLMRA